MQEDLLHFIWKYKKLQWKTLVCSHGEVVIIEKVGIHNQLAGPDFFNAKIRLDGQLWAGNVEIHIKSSDWYVHNHQNDENYNNVILHVVWEDDVSVFRNDGSEIPTLELKRYVSKTLLIDYQNLFDKQRYTFINCEKSISEVDYFLFQNWLERLYFERLERKSNFIFNLLVKYNNDWEQVLFTLLLKNFGLKINGEAFLSLANALPFSVVRKLQSNVVQLESVFFGMTHMLNNESVLDNYYIELVREYNFLNRKFELLNDGVLKPDFFKLRPTNFPTVRLSQLANLYGKHQSLFEKIMSGTDVKTLRAIFSVSTSDYWSNHYTFGKVSKKSEKKLTKSFVDLILINTILPLKFCYAKHLGKGVDENIIEIITKILPERNSILSNFMKHKVNVENAKDSQAFLQLYNEYCTKNRCLECAVGGSLLQGND